MSKKRKRRIPKDVLPDIDDVLENAIGGMLAAMGVWLFSRWWRKRRGL